MNLLIRDEELRDLTKRLRELGGKEGNWAVKETVREAGRIVATKAVPEAPVRTGRLARSIRFKATNRDWSYVKAGTARAVPYANPIHWGWRKHGIKPNPFLWRALAGSKDEVQRELMQNLEKAIAEWAARVSRSQTTSVARSANGDTITFDSPTPGD